MYTLKIRWTRHVHVESDNARPEPMSLADEMTLFVPADQVRVHASIPAGERLKVMKHWHDDRDDHGYFSYLCLTDGEEQAGRLICVTRDDTETWYTASHAWLLGPDGGTIERVAP